MTLDLAHLICVHLTSIEAASLRAAARFAGLRAERLEVSTGVVPLPSLRSSELAAGKAHRTSYEEQLEPSNMAKTLLTGGRRYVLATKDLRASHITADSDHGPRDARRRSLSFGRRHLNHSSLRGSRCSRFGCCHWLRVAGRTRRISCAAH